ncbi:MAG TPA: outer membrane beta-barrel protein [Candidatus Polarisedimenticolia bacterium]
MAQKRGTAARGLGKLVWGLVVCLSAAALTAPAQAEDLRGRWYFGGHLGFLSTTDSIRSNADIIIGPVGDDGIPFTGDLNEEQGCVGALSTNTYCDPRPDDLLSRETTIEETVRAELDAGFGITSWLTFQLDASYFRGDVGPVDTFLRDHFPVSSGATAGVLDRFDDRERIIPVQAGTITEIPISLTGIVRFRKDSPLNPYVGVGLGMVFANIERSNDVDELNNRIASMRIRGIRDEFNEPIGNPPSSQTVNGRIPFQNALRVDVKDSFEWHLVAGAEYFFNDKLSLVFDARYVFADQYLELDLGGEDQINLLIFSEKLFRPDGSVQIFSYKGEAPNTLCADTGKPDGMGGTMYVGAGCNNQPNGFVNPGISNCPTSGDFDGDGQTDRCYGQNVGESPSGIRDPRGDVIVQGGRISLTGFAIATGLRFHF